MKDDESNKKKMEPNKHLNVPLIWKFTHNNYVLKYFGFLKLFSLSW